VFQPDAALREEAAPGGRSLTRRLLPAAIFVVVVLVFLYFILPRIAGLKGTWHRIKDGDPGWLAVAAVMELASFGGYVILFRTVFGKSAERIRWRESYLITMAGVVATRLLATAGAGGIALTVWALRRAGMRRRDVAEQMTTFMVLLYSVFFMAMVVCGIGLRTHVFEGNAPAGLTIVPAVIGGVVIGLALLASRVPRDLDRRWRGSPGWWPENLMVRVGAAAATVAGGVRGAIRLVRQRRPGTLGAVAWWGFDIATLWASFHAFGQPPPTAVLVTAYFVGQIGNTLPLPGGVGGVEGGLIGSLVAFGVDGGLALVAVLTYRAFSFWLPMIPGAIAYLRLTRVVKGWGDEPEEEDD
jgi:uncharacterized membrane protein YbhN (UPF0104 family)